MGSLFRRSLVAAVVIHVGLLTAGGALAPRLQPDAAPDPLRPVEVALETPEPRRVVPTDRVALRPLHRAGPSFDSVVPRSAAPAPRRALTPGGLAQAGRGTRATPEPGGALNLGSASERGDLPGLPSGQTPLGWVPGPDVGKGAGSGTAPGVGSPEPPPSDPQPEAPATPPPARQEPPAPRRISVRLCAVSRLRPNPHCPDTVAAEFTEGAEPQGTCALHKPAPPPAPVAPAPPERSREEPRFVPARLVRTVKPEYPESALESDHQGSVLLRAEVRPDGSCGEVAIIESSGSRVLDQAAVKAVKQWRWEPARRGAEPVASTVRCRVRFEIEE